MLSWIADKWWRSWCNSLICFASLESNYTWICDSVAFTLLRWVTFYFNFDFKLCNLWLFMLPKLFTTRSLILFHPPDIHEQHTLAPAWVVHYKKSVFVTAPLFCCCCCFLPRRWHLEDRKFRNLQSTLSVRSNVTPAWSLESALPITRNVLPWESVLSRLDLLKVV